MTIINANLVVLLTWPAASLKKKSCGGKLGGDSKFADGDLPINQRLRRAVDYQCTHTPGVTFHGPSGRAAVGRDACADFSARLLETFPDLRHEVDEVYWMGTQQEGFLCSTRWSANGTHRGGSAYGPATHKSVQIWGITQHRIVDGRVVEEWTMFNELDLMMQLVARD